MSEPDVLRSAGGKLSTWVDAGEVGDVFVVLDRHDVELGRAVAVAGITPGFVRADFDPPVALPAAREIYQVKRIPKAEIV